LLRVLYILSIFGLTKALPQNTGAQGILGIRRAS
jgi:hypothetical protein